MLDDGLVLYMPMEENSGNLTYDYSCYDNETEILTEEGWKFFKDLNKNEKVATLKTQDLKTED